MIRSGSAQRRSYPRVRFLALIAAATTMAWLMPAVAKAANGFTTQVSPPDETNATEPSVAVDRADGTIYVAWQASGSHVARSDNGGRTFVQKPELDLFGRDLGDVDVRVGGPTPCSTSVAPIGPPDGTLTGGCTPGTHRVYVSSLERLPLVLQVKLAYSDDR